MSEIDFKLTPYTELRDALLGCGIKCGINGRHQITVSVQEGAIWPDRGNSFWVTNATGGWHLFTWSPIGYRVPGDVDLVELCKKCMTRGNSAMHSVPEDIVDEFTLERLDDAEQDLVYASMKTSP